MSAPIIEVYTIIPFAVFTASLLGSGHCVAMCGGLMLSSTPTKSSIVEYHLGRLAGYLILGALAGSLGHLFLNTLPASEWESIFSWLAVCIFSLAFILSGVRVWRGHPLHFTFINQKLLSKLYKSADNQKWILGFLSALLPCGWLHSFVLGAVATRSTLYGAGFLFTFWLGTLPALGVTPWLMNRAFSPLSRKAPKAAALVLIFAGLTSLGIKIIPALQPHLADTKTNHGSCH